MSGVPRCSSIRFPPACALWSIDTRIDYPVILLPLGRQRALAGFHREVGDVGPRDGENAVRSGSSLWNVAGRDEREPVRDGVDGNSGGVQVVATPVVLSVDRTSGSRRPDSPSGHSGRRREGIFNGDTVPLVCKFFRRIDANVRCIWPNYHSHRPHPTTQL